MDYLDTSLVVATLTKEAATESARSWLAGRPTEDICISDWVITEVSSALSMKVRTGTLPADHRARALAIFRKMTSESLTTLPVAPSHFHQAALLADQHHLGLRGADALHLAIASDIGARLCTLDRRLAEAATKIGASVLHLT